MNPEHREQKIDKYSSVARYGFYAGALMLAVSTLHATSTMKHSSQKYHELIHEPMVECTKELNIDNYSSEVDCSQLELYSEAFHDVVDMNEAKMEGTLYIGFAGLGLIVSSYGAAAVARSLDRKEEES